MADPRKILGTRSQHPPSDLHTRQLPIKELSGNLYRIHQSENGPIYFGRSKTTRFDHPDGTAGTFGTLYVAQDEYGAFIETFGESEGNTVSEAGLSSKSISTITIKPMQFVDVTASGAAHIGAAGEISAGDHALSQLWAKELFHHPDKPDGIYYRARHDLSKFSIAIFDRSPKLVGCASTVGLMDLPFRPILGKILDHYRFSLV